MSIQNKKWVCHYCNNLCIYTYEEEDALMMLCPNCGQLVTTKEISPVPVSAINSSEQCDSEI